MKHQPATPRKKPPHALVPELVRALAMPPEKRRLAANRRRKETMAEILATGWPGKQVRQPGHGSSSSSI